MRRVLIFHISACLPLEYRNPHKSWDFLYEPHRKHAIFGIGIHIHPDGDVLASGHGQELSLSAKMDWLANVVSNKEGHSIGRWSLMQNSAEPLICYVEVDDIRGVPELARVDQRDEGGYMHQTTAGTTQVRKARRVKQRWAAADT